MSISYDLVRELFDYDPNTGVLTRKSSNKEAGTQRTDGRRQTGINRRVYFQHRLIWLWMTGNWPQFEIDHKDGDGANNRWENLRDVPHPLNARNKVKAKGFSWKEDKQKYHARAWSSRGEPVHLGYHDCLLDARAAYLRYLRENNLTPPHFEASIQQAA